MEDTYSCPQCSFCVDHDLMLRVLKHFFNCTSFQYIMDLSCGHQAGLGHSCDHFQGTVPPQQRKKTTYKHVSRNNPTTSLNKDVAPPAHTEPTFEENETESKMDNSSTILPPAEIKTEPPEIVTVVEPVAPPTQMMDTAAFGEACHPVSVVCAMGGVQSTSSAVAGCSTSNETVGGDIDQETERHTITTEPMGAPSMVVSRPSSMAVSQASPVGSHGNNDGGSLELDRLLDSDRAHPQDLLQQTFKAVQLMAKRQRELETQQAEFIATVTRMLETTPSNGGATTPSSLSAASGSSSSQTASTTPNPVPPPAKKIRQAIHVEWLKPNSPKICEELPDDKLRQIRKSSNCPAHFAVRCARMMFSGPEMVSRNVQGRGKTALNPVKIARIKDYVARMYNTEEDMEIVWRSCRRRIDTWGRHLKSTGVPSEKDFTE